MSISATGIIFNNFEKDEYYHEGPLSSSVTEKWCDGRGEGPLKRHSAACGDGIGIFFILHDVTVTVGKREKLKFTLCNTGCATK